MSTHRIVFITADGTEHPVQATSGQTLMQCAQENLVPGILGDCGGCCSCATCHGYVDPAWISRVGPATEDERLLLDGGLDVRPNSRLTCQVFVAPELDGLVVHLPASQR